MRFEPCTVCRRHVLVDHARCPFCDAEVAAPAPRPLPPDGLSRGGQIAWLLLLGASTASCAAPAAIGPTPEPPGPAPHAAASMGALTSPAAGAADGAAPRDTPAAIDRAPDPAALPPVPVLFDAGSQKLGPAAEAVVDALADEAKKRPTFDVSVSGYADASEAPNVLPLSSFRARAVRDALVARGVSAQRFTVYAYGDDRPVDASGTREGQARNRHVVVRLTPPPEPLPEGTRFGVAIYGESGFMPAAASFAPGSAVVSPAVRRSLEAFAEVLLSEPRLKVEVEGHADPAEAGAERLSESRAKAAFQVLVELGVPVERLSAKGYGSAHHSGASSKSERAAARVFHLRIVEGGEQRHRMD